LGLNAPVCLGLPDGELSDHEADLTDHLAGLLAAVPKGMWCASTWRGDGHPDHEAVGRACAAAAKLTGAALLEYPVWMWHWAVPDDDYVPWHRMSRVRLDPVAIECKARAAKMFRTQLTSQSGADAILPPFVVRRLLSVGEAVFH
jgi:LmbE family N-acetylglucosaminyl deacetylase